MPLSDGCSYETVQKNIVKLIKEGRTAKQAAAIAFDHAKRQGCDMTKVTKSRKKKRPPE